MQVMATGESDELGVNEFLARVKELGETQDREDDERAKRLEDEILAGRRARQQRRADRERSLSPSKRETTQKRQISAYSGAANTTEATLEKQMAQSDNIQDATVGHNSLHHPIKQTEVDLERRSETQLLREEIAKNLNTKITQQPVGLRKISSTTTPSASMNRVPLCGLTQGRSDSMASDPEAKSDPTWGKAHSFDGAQSDGMSDIKSQDALSSLARSPQPIASNSHNASNPYATKQKTTGLTETKQVDAKSPRSSLGPSPQMPVSGNASPVTTYGVRWQKSSERIQTPPRSPGSFVSSALRRENTLNKHLAKVNSPSTEVSPKRPMSTPPAVRKPSTEITKTSLTLGRPASIHVASPSSSPAYSQHDFSQTSVESPTSSPKPSSSSPAAEASPRAYLNRREEKMKSDGSIALRVSNERRPWQANKSESWLESALKRSESNQKLRASSPKPTETTSLKQPLSAKTTSLEQSWNRPHLSQKPLVAVKPIAIHAASQEKQEAPQNTQSSLKENTKVSIETSDNLRDSSSISATNSESHGPPGSPTFDFRSTLKPVRSRSSMEADNVKETLLKQRQFLRSPTNSPKGQSVSGPTLSTIQKPSGLSSPKSPLTNFTSLDNSKPSRPGSKLQNRMDPGLSAIIARGPHHQPPQKATTYPPVGISSHDYSNEKSSPTLNHVSEFLIYP